MCQVKLVSRYSFQSIQLGGVAEPTQRYIFLRVCKNESRRSTWQNRAQCDDATATRCSAVFESFDASLVFGLAFRYPHIGPLVFGVRNF